MTEFQDTLCTAVLRPGLGSNPQTAHTARTRFKALHLAAPRDAICRASYCGVTRTVVATSEASYCECTQAWPICEATNCGLRPPLEISETPCAADERGLHRSVLQTVQTPGKPVNVPKRAVPEEPHEYIFTNKRRAVGPPSRKSSSAAGSRGSSRAILASNRLAPFGMLV